MKAESGDVVVVVNQDDAKDEAKEKLKTPPFSNYWRILAFGTKLEHAVVLLAVVCAGGSGVALPLLNVVFGKLAGNFTGYFTPGNTITVHDFKHSVSSNALYIVYLALAKFVLSYVARLGFRVMGLRISASMRLSYLQALFAQPVEKLDKISTGTVANTITSSANTIQRSISDRLASLFQSLALVIAAYAIAFKYSWVLTLVTSSGILFVIVVYSIITPFTLKAQQKVDKADEKHATVTGEAISSIRTVASLNAETKMIEKHSKWTTESYRAGLRLAKHIGGQLFPAFFAIYACFSLAFWFGLKLFREGHIANVGTVIVVFFSVLIVVSVMGTIVQPLMDITKAVSVSGSFFDMIDSDRVDTTGLQEPTVSALESIELQNVNFAYPTRPDVPVLKDLSMVFEAGKTTALVGPSGSGKSTIVALLERWYDLGETKMMKPTTNKALEKNAKTPETPTTEPKPPLNSSGSIMTEGHNINAFDLKWWRTRIGLVQQEPFLFDDTIERNVAFGLVGTSWENAEPNKKLELVKEACREAFADEFIERLPDGYSSRVGEGGIQLSGGQRQRIAIARSIVRKPAILILDEATSAIDVRSEKIVQEALDRASKNRTTIVIAHRLSTIRKASKIIVLRGGTKIEEGTHEHLLSLEGGLYKGLVESQHIQKDEYDSKAEASEFLAESSIDLASDELTRTKSFVDSLDPERNPQQVSSHTSYKNRGFLRVAGIILYEQRKSWLLQILLLIAILGAGTGSSLSSWLFAKLIQAFQYTGQRLIDAANFWALMFFILALSVGTMYGMLGLTSETLAAHVGNHARKSYFQNTLKMPITYFDREENASGSVMQRLSGDPKQLQELTGLRSTLPLYSIAGIVGSVILAFHFGWKLALVTFFAATPFIMAAGYVRVRQEFMFEQLNGQVFMKSSQFATEAVSAFRTVASLAMEDFIVERYRQLLQDQIRTSTRKAISATLVYAFSESIELCAMALTFWYGGQLLASREYNAFQFFVVYSAMILTAQQAGQSMSITTNIALSTAAANRIFELQSQADRLGQKTLPPAPRATTNPIADNPTINPQTGAKVEFKDITFNYPSNSTPLFSNLNLTIQPGQFIAFVGASGCGKTTTISLLERFYDPVSGAILFDGQNIAEQDVRTYRGKIALVAQEPRLFSGTIRQNLLIGLPDDTDSKSLDSSSTEEKIIEACRSAEIHDFIVSLPQGYDTDLGQSSSSNLSGGQKQRLCLARALLRKPRLLLLDEATSSLDSQSERLVQNAIERLVGAEGGRNMTVIAVAHRLATIQKADVIYVFGERDPGRNRGSKVVEVGNHSELLARRGVYWSMCQAQALDN